MIRLFRTAAPPLLAALLFSSALGSHERISTRLSWNGDPGRIIRARCVTCHAGTAKRPDLRRYVTARPWARAMREAILEGHAAVWNGGALTGFERELLVQWIDGGAPDKTAADKAPAATPARYRRIASPNPLATLDAWQARLGGTRGVIPGLGLSLRTADEIIVIDRGAGDGERVIAKGAIVPSLAAHLASLPAGVARTRVSNAAFIVGPLDEPRTEVAEIPIEGPDRFWCPMHPEVRSPAPGSCPRCAMKLVEMPPLSLDTFALEVVKTEPLDEHNVRVTLRVTRGAKRQPVTSFVTVHERPFHLFAVDGALEAFEHVHPVVSGSNLIAEINLPRGTERWLVADFVPVDALPQMRMARLPAEVLTRGTASDAPASPSRITMSAGAARAGRETRLTFTVTDARSGEPPPDLEPYLGAAAHLFIIDEGLREPMHAHPIDLPEGGLARPAFDVRFPREGRYVMWLQVQRAGRVETRRFTSQVSK